MGFVLAVATSTALLPTSVASASDDPDRDTVAQLSADLRDDADGQVRISVDPTSDLVTLVGATADHALTDPSAAPPEAVARDFVDRYGPMFGSDEPDDDLVIARDDDGLAGTSVVRFEQRIDDVPVIGGQVAVQLDAGGSVVSASGETAPIVDVDTSPTVPADTAAATARGLTAKYDRVDPALLTVSAPELQVYDPSLIGASDIPSSSLVWRVDVRTAMGDVERLVLVDAHTGSVALHVSTVHAVLHNSVCDNANDDGLDEHCITPVRVDTPVATGNPDVDGAYDLARVTYDFYLANFGRDSIDGLGMPLVSTVRFCPPNPDTTFPIQQNPRCPYENAFWNGEQMVYGEGYATADDVVAHELTHGVTEHTSELFYYAESGAINESISDVFGELIDQTSTVSGADPPGDRWKLGEQLQGGALRSMSDPTFGNNPFGDPDRMTSPLYVGSPIDSHGVHSNSGVGNKAAFLITDGGTFNGQTITGLGAAKTARIYYQAETTLLGPGSDYLDLYGALQQACTNLVGTSGITVGNCQQVTKAVTATEMHLAPTKTGARLTAPECAGGTVRGASLFTDDMEAGLGKWVTSATNPTALWQSFVGSSQSGSRSMYGPDIEVDNGTNDFSMSSAVRIATPISIPAGTTYLRFDHSFNLEGNGAGTAFYDGGVIEYSVTGPGGQWKDVKDIGAMVNGYTGTLDAGIPQQPSSNPLAGRAAFSDTSPGYQTTRVDVSALAGQPSVLFRFRIGTDQNFGADGWFIDDVAVYRCGAPAIAGAPTFASAVPLDGAVQLAWTAPASTGFPTLTDYVVTPFVNGVAQNAVNTGGAAPSFVVGGLTNGVTYTFTVAARNATGIGPAATTGPATPAVGATALAPYFDAVGPVRVLDTRPGESPNALRTVPKSKVGGAAVLEVQVADLPGVTPATGMSAVSLNVTATETTAGGFVTVYPCGPRGLVSNLNYSAGATVANATITPVSPTGTVCLFASTAVHLVVDINGWFATSPGFTPVGPARVIDTRPGESPDALRVVRKATIGPADVLEVQVAGLPGVTPASGVGAVSLNVTATGTTGPGFVTVYPCGPRTLVSNVNFATGDTVPNATITPVSATGTICLYASTETHIVVDMNGWFSTNPGFNPIGPARVLDTRVLESPNALRNVQKQQIGGARVLQVQVSDLPGFTPPAGIRAVSLNVTATNTTGAGFLTIDTCGQRGLVSSLNYAAGDTVANAVLTPISATGTICIFSSADVDLIVDINGWFAG